MPKCKVVGLRKFTSKKEGSGDWVNVWVQVPMADGGLGVSVEKYLCRPSVLPDVPENVINKEYAVCTRNNFISDFIPLK